MSDPHARSAGIAAGVLLASTSTLVCCVLPVALVSIGAGATLVSLVAAFPQLVWLSEHKMLVFGVVAVCLAVGGVALWRARRLPCPVDPDAARACRRWRRVGGSLYGLSVAAYVVGATFAFLLPVAG
jgi:hypothetical protein